MRDFVDVSRPNWKKVMTVVIFGSLSSLSLSNSSDLPVSCQGFNECMPLFVSLVGMLFAVLFFVSSAILVVSLVVWHFHKRRKAEN